MPKKEKSKDEPTLGQTILEDLRRGDFRNTLQNDFADLKEFYIDEKRKRRLDEMGNIRGAAYMFLWLIKSLVFKLNPSRRIILILSVILLVLSFQINGHGNHTATTVSFDVLAYFVVLFLLMLELKDKLLAKDELEVGRSVQSALMPDRMPSIPGWRVWLYTTPAKEVGGDMVDFMEISDEKFSVTIGDVSGKGLGAALLMAKLQATIRAYAPETENLSLFGEKVNKIFYRDTVAKCFASLVHIELTANSSDIKLLNAGHLPPILISQERIVQLRKTSPALGLMKNAVFAEQAMEMQMGEKLFVFSDGLTEAMNAYGEFFGDERLAKVAEKYKSFKCREFGESVLNIVTQFVGSAGAHDDLSIIVIERVADCSVDCEKK